MQISLASARPAVAVSFLGRDTSPPAGAELARVDQVHSARVLEVDAPGSAGRADGLVTKASELTLAVQVADCLPVLLGAETRVGALHAGWRGFAAGILTDLARFFDPATTLVFLGPAIGPCCFEVGLEVVDALGLSSGDAARRPHPDSQKAFVDLRGLASRRLRAQGFASIVTVGGCTRCEADAWWSYRRDGARAGRNLALISRAASAQTP